MPGSTIPRRIRWWPAAVIVVLTIVRLLWIWIPQTDHRQSQVIGSSSTILGASLLLLLWFLLLSRATWKLRLAALGAAVALCAVGGATLRVRGVTGDLVPILEWRMGRSSMETPVSIGAPLPEGSISSPRDYPQFLGPGRDGIVDGPELERDWGTNPPRLLWKRAVGEGWSGFAVAGDHAVTQEQRGPRELVTCYDVRSGEPRWTHGDDVRFDDPLGGPGPRATPAVHGDRVYALGATGILNALELSTGRKVWSVDVLEDNDAMTPVYGVSASPLIVDGRLVVVSVGGSRGSLVAYDADTGRKVWAAGDDPPAYSSPVLVELAGRRQIVVLNGRHVVGHDVTTGDPLWRFPWPRGTEKVSQPVVLPPDRLFVSTGYGVGGRLLAIRDAGSVQEAELVWSSAGLKAKFTNVVHRDGHLYGLDDGILACIGVGDGQRRWKRGRYGHGQTILTGDLLLVTNEDGQVAMVEASPDVFRELGVLSAVDGKTWNHSALAGALLLVRNDREAACYELPLAGENQRPNTE